MIRIGRRPAVNIAVRRRPLDDIRQRPKRTCNRFLIRAVCRLDLIGNLELDEIQLRFAYKHAWVLERLCRDALPSHGDGCEQQRQHDDRL